MDYLYLALGMLLLLGYRGLQMRCWYRRELTEAEARIWFEDPLEITEPEENHEVERRTWQTSSTWL